MKNRLRKIVLKKYRTPCYIYEGEVIQKQFNKLKGVFNGFEFFYSLKSNPNISICSFMKSLGLKVEISSGGELYLVKKVGYLPNEVIFNGPGKSDDELTESISDGILAINCNSIGELRRIIKITDKLKKKIRINLRINPELGSINKQFKIVMGNSESRFGIVLCDLDKVKKLSSQYVAISGIHVYMGSQNLNADLIMSNLNLIAGIAKKVSDYLGIELDIIDFGGGIGVPYAFNDKKLDTSLLKRKIRVLIKQIRRTDSIKNARLLLEPGRFLVAESGSYYVSVTDIITTKSKTFIIVDGGFTHLIRPSLMKVNHAVRVVNNDNNSHLFTKVTICGPSSTPEDTLASEIEIQRIKVGDILEIRNVGAYGLTQSPLHFISFSTPVEVLTYENMAYEIRSKGKYKDHLLNQKNIQTFNL